MKRKKVKYDVAKDGLEAVDKWKSGNFHLILVSRTFFSSSPSLFHATPQFFSSVYIRGKGGFISDMYLPQLFVFS